jgi:O-antigen/teichoic acid export membrane protein
VPPVPFRRSTGPRGPLLSGGRALTAATLIVAVSGYAVIVIAGHALDAADYERFTVYWGLFFALTGVLDGLLHETTRSVSATRYPDAPAAGTTAARPVVVAVWSGVAAAAVALLTAWWWADRLVPGTGVPGVLLLVAGLASYAVQAAVGGLLSAMRRWRRYAALIAVDSAVRVVLAAVAWATGLELVAFLLVTVIGAVTWTGLLVIGGSRRMLRLRADATPLVFLRRTGAAMTASGANALLVTGFPVLLTATSPAGTAPGALAAVITAVTVTRAPLLVPLQRFQPALIVRFSRRGAAALPGPVAVVVACSALVALGLWLLGRPVLRLFFPAGLVAPPGTLAALGLASGALALLMLSGVWVLAAGRHGLYVLGWLTATVVAVIVLSGVDATPAARAVTALGAAPLVGVLVHLAGSVRRRPAPEPVPDPHPGCSSGRTA